MDRKIMVPQADSLPRRWDIFCQVVDNFGDVGVCWRLARQLEAEYGASVRLWVDDLNAFHKLFPASDPTLKSQVCLAVEVLLWTPAFPQVEPAEVVIEAFGCRLPAGYVAAMAEKSAKPLWINLEYLSAEAWVEGCHRLPSPHPVLPLVKHFFFPGFTAKTGGLPLENGLLERRAAFQRSPQEKAAFWASLGWEMPAPDVVTISLFCYHNPAVPGLLAAWAAAATPVVCCVAEGMAAAAVAAALGRERLPAGAQLQSGNLSVRILPFLEQDAYDRLLWTCDCNFVRGEDSFVRAQWAAKPLVWHIYPQDGQAHEAKLSAFLDSYCADLPPVAAHAMRNLWWQWNRGEISGQAWDDFRLCRPALEAHARRWAETIRENGGLATNLVEFCKAMIK